MGALPFDLLEQAARDAAADRARAAAAIRATVERGTPVPRACPAARPGCRARDYDMSGRTAR